MLTFQPIIDRYTTQAYLQHPDLAWLEVVSSVNDSMVQATESFTVLAFTRDEFADFLKFMAATVHSINENPPEHITKSVHDWYPNAKKVMQELKIPTRPLDAVYKRLQDPNKLKTETQQNQYGDDTKELRQVIQKNVQKVINHPAVNRDYAKLLRPMLTYLNNWDDKKLAEVQQHVHHVNDPKLNTLFKSGMSSSEQLAAQKAHLNFVRKHAGPTAEYLEKKHLDKLTDDQKAEHNKLRLAAGKAFQGALRDHVYSTGQNTVDIEHARKALHNKGFNTWRLAKGYKGKIDADGNYYTPYDEKLKGKVGIPATWIKHNPDYKKGSGSYYVEYATPQFGDQNKGQKLYTAEHVGGGREFKKGFAVERLQKYLPKMQEAWRSDMRSKDPHKKMLGMMAETLFHTSARAGSRVGAQTKNQDTFGLTTWQKRHMATLANGALRIKYLGGKDKTGGGTTHIIKPDDEHKKQLVDYMNDHLEDKKPSEHVWQHGSNRVSSGDFNKYLKSVVERAGAPEKEANEVSAKNFRTFKGTDLFNKLAAKVKVPANPTAKQMKDIHNKLTLAVGKELGHKRTDKDGNIEDTGTTAAKSYILHQPQIDFFRKHGHQPPTVFADSEQISNDHKGDWWEGKDEEAQREYVHEHPHTKKKISSKPRVIHRAKRRVHKVKVID